MTVMEEFNLFAFQRARSKYLRRQFKEMEHNDWVALVEGYMTQNERLEAEIHALEDELGELRD